MKKLNYDSMANLEGGISCSLLFYFSMVLFVGGALTGGLGTILALGLWSAGATRCTM